MSLVGFEPTITEGERLYTYALDRTDRVGRKLERVPGNLFVFSQGLAVNGLFAEKINYGIHCSCRMHRMF
jgi:hypothetical protein